MSKAGKRTHPGRIALVIGLIILWNLFILARLGQLQIFEHEEFLRLALQGQQKTRTVNAPRGAIYDSHMDELATSVVVSTVFAEPKRIDDIPAAANKLAKILGLDAPTLRKRMANPAMKEFVVVKRRIDPQAVPKIESLGIDGIGFQEESMRAYPNRELACHVLGFVNMEGDGGAGLELQYDKELKGTDGLISTEVDAHHRSFQAKVEKPPVQGHSLVLSIDKSLQYVAERELAAGVEAARARSGTAIVMEVDTGRILAMANYPNFNCNTYNSYPAGLWKNPAVSDMFEPGSTFKVVVATAALEAGLVRSDEIIDCQMGSIAIGGHIFHDHKPYGLLTMNQVLEHSSNVGASKLGLRLGEKQLYDALRLFGFGSKTKVDLPGEIVGLVRDWKSWSGLSIGAISFGQEVGVTSMQMVAAINTIATGGYRVRPTLVDRVIDQEGNLVRKRTPLRTRIVSEKTALAISNAFEGVVLRGTGMPAALEGYRAAGKTGTAQKIIDRKYSNTDYLASFIGFAPLPDPEITVLVQIDSPRGSIYGGTVAGPVFARITQEILLLLHVPPDQSLPLPKVDPRLIADAEDFRPNATPVMPLQDMTDPEPVSRPGAITVRAATASARMPDFRGLSKREVISRCQELGIRVKTSGAGTAIFQLPPPDTAIPLGDTCSVSFARGAVAVRDANRASGGKKLARKRH
jgi:cell division protein FtsI (penicillin-binding protein 3)